MKKFKVGSKVVPSNRMISVGKQEWPKQGKKFKPINVTGFSSEVMLDEQRRLVYDVKGISVCFYSYELKKGS
jgi:hypothetical protein